MPPPPASTARSSSRSSKTSDSSARGGGASEGSLIAVGEIVAAHALNGLLRFRPYQPPAPSLAPGRTVLLESRSRRQAVRVVSAAPHGRGLLLVGLEGVHDRTTAEALVHARVLVPADELPAPAEDEFYWHEVVGFRVETVDGTPLGKIVDVFHSSTDVWTVRGAGREFLIPVIRDVVRVLDRAARRAVIEPLPGLLD